MPVRSAGLLIYRLLETRLEILLVHPGGPFWAKKDEGAWSIPKGLIEAGEDELSAAIREAQEELGAELQGSFARLGEYRQPGGKVVVVWSVEADASLDVETVRSSEFQIEWPPRSGRIQSFPEVDRAGWFATAEAEIKILKGQLPMLADLVKQLGRV
ncbi:NUDIX domain-containing protein [Rhizobium bangladeshense]|uniref:NUDIX domain-containing protein n=1 Tax=Rhizobium bangladeshense TaxID=1138189 RepID=A0ABS7LKE7_9HYPH|nr:NUDIX domain-containing protein [Rhizobium bangladeshense]MBX4867240.1 NUDIX domain-containing protein [Rhizobium bangladeshense]MBX4871531.1 NUDIX domain-containing protein [Rhizobium bangladeshense]MBX4882845.1 NUDIX domain-containing protein [Rhizobium bangladeshense]MBX4896987.1 NUDIX domain-containing protein [Rhizobium bangladeshense]MBX4900974.1 NUDIX domain-containing protein [Rhizobium bangladeshense]